MTKTIKSLNQKPPSKWFINGSYVLDHLFGTNFAHDIDVWFLRDTANPTTQEINDFAAKLGMEASPPHPQPQRVDDYFSHAGGFPSLNIEFLQLDMDGNVYQIDPKTQTRTLFQRSGPIEVKIVDQNALTPGIAAKAIRKLGEHPNGLTCDAATLATLKAFAST